MSLRKIIDNFGISLEKLGRNVSQRNIITSSTQYKKDKHNVVRIGYLNKYGETIGGTNVYLLKFHS